MHISLLKRYWYTRGSVKKKMYANRKGIQRQDLDQEETAPQHTQHKKEEMDKRQEEEGKSSEHTQ